MPDNTSLNYKFKEEWDAFINKGDLGSLELVYTRYFDLLFNYADRFNTDHQFIEDAIQNVFISLIKIRKKLVRVRNLHAYLISSFRNELFHIIARNRKIRLLDNFPEFAFAPVPDAEVEVIKDELDSELKNTLHHCIKNLTPSQQEILFMRYNTGLSYEEISGILDITIESCRTAVYRALKSIKKDIDEKINHKGIVI